MNFSTRALAILSVVIPSLFVMALFQFPSYPENFSFVEKVEARPNRAVRAQNLAKKNRKTPENRDTRKARKKAKDPIQDVTKDKEKQKRIDWETGQEARLRQKIEDEEKQKEREYAQRKAAEGKEKRRKAELATKRPEGAKELARMATKTDEWKIFRKEMLKAMNEKDLSTDYIKRIAQIDSQWVSKFNEYIGIYNAALSEPGSLLETEKTIQISLLEKVMEQIEWQFYGTLKTYESPEPTYFIVPTPSYVPVPVYSPPPSQEDHQKMCNRKTAENALRGAAWSSGASRELYELGCTTKDQYCNGWAIVGTPSYLWPQECRE